jgi:hypothetical protein
MAFGARCYDWDDRTGYLLVPARYANTLGAMPDHHCVIRDRGPIRRTRSVDAAVGGRADQRM